MSGTAFLANLKTNTWFHRLDPRVKFSYLCGVLIASLVFLDVFWLVVVLLSTLPFWVAARVDLRPLKGPLLGAGLMLLSLMLFMFSFSSSLGLAGESDTAIDVGPFSFYFSAAAIGLAQVLRLAVPLLTSLLVFATTDPTDLGRAMMRLRVPGEIAFMFVTTFTILPIALQEATNITDAQRIRGVFTRGVRNRIRATRLFMLPMFVNTLRASRDRGIAAECRAFGARRWRHSLVRAPLQRSDYLMLAFTAVLVTAALYVRFGLGLGWGRAL